MAKSVRVCQNQFLKFIHRPRTLIMTVILAIFIYCMLQPFVDIAQQNNFGLTPYAFPFLTNDHIAHLVILSVAVLLFSSAPFVDDATPYIISRSGMPSYATGNVFFILVLSILYTATVALISVLCILPVVQWGTDWGDGWRAISQYEFVAQYFRVFDISRYLLATYTAPMALWISIVLEICVVFFLGMTTMTLNRLTRRPVGLWVAIAFAVMDFGTCNLLPLFLVKVSPVSLSSLTAIAEYNNFLSVGLNDAVIFFVISIIVLVLSYQAVECIYYLQRKKGIL